MKHLLLAFLASATLCFADATFPSPDGTACVQFTGKKFEVIHQPTGNKSKTEELLGIGVEVQWSPDSSKVAVCDIYKRQTLLEVFEIKNGKITLTVLDDDLLNKLHALIPKKHGRFFNINPVAWTKDGNLKVEVSGNTISEEGELLSDTTFHALLAIKGENIVLLSTSDLVTKKEEGKQ